MRSQTFLREFIKMSFLIILGILLPLIGTTLGACFVFFKGIRGADSKILSGFAAGVMAAACVWSLIIPAVEMSFFLGFFSFVPMLSGLWFGVIFLILCEKIPFARKNDGFLFYFAVILHNIPEGMAVGVAFASALDNNGAIGLASAFLLSFGIAMQNIPEGAIISLPLSAGGKSGRKSFVLGSLSGIVEPIAACLTLVFSSVVTFLLPYLLGFAAGAMLYVSLSELLPKASGTKGNLWFLLGFSVMMVLDVALG